MKSNDRLYLINMHNCPFHINADLEVVLVNKGCVRVNLGNSSFELSENQFTVIPPYRLHGFEILQKADSLVYMFPHAVVSDICNIFRNRETKNLVSPLDSVVSKYISSTTEKLSSEYNPFIEKSILYAFLSSFMQDNFFTKMSFSSSSVNRVIEYIYSNTENDISPTSVATKFGISVSKLNNMLCDYTGYGFKDFVSHLRVSRAVSLLEQNDMNITEISYASGFNTLRTFNRIFLRIIGCTPTEYRKQLNQ